ncbi:uncharacterized protein PHACADRAFT_199901 [Phanerochaete carnosa HHB-10118-sp]|uniref:P-loop containing nucleoside triphosphate hydrolase protein n=1 Tax=Phanerochaete carnosa (strain HHB-10118-sp) TaxID=650164 RepID=K5VWU4_PHACS|nr:uncharacterized protein PHACADRAFT_199901 [Phanerochaete carnosa HHB-10118-sp]EKM51069.1 hypothetical protein PHACADRAFT_199901 [Phanerochaete carnosa HHB-10118-sp]
MGFQVELGWGGLDSIPRHMQFFLAANTVLALNVLLLTLRIWRASVSVGPKLEQCPHASASRATDVIRRHVFRIGGLLIFVLKIARLAALIALLSLVIVAAMNRAWLLLDTILVEVLSFAVVLAFASVLVPARTALTLSPHLTVIACTIFATYAYRDIWPLMTYKLRPQDESEGKLVWAKVALAAWAGFLSPILEPYPYVPSCHESPENGINAEQTASLFSRAFFTFLDPVIWRAFHASRLSHEELPPLTDYDQAKYLTEQSFPHLDPLSNAGKTSLLWAMLKVLRKPVFCQVACILCMALVRLASPIGVNRLLSFLENDREDAFVQPWVWILWIALGPIADTVLKQQNTFLSTRSLARMEAVFTALIFEHALRLRSKSGVADSANTQPPDTKAASQNATSNDSGSLVGRIMNLATSDLDNITAGRDFLMLCVGVPAEMIFSLWFLYIILGWSALVGFAVMAVLFIVFKDIASLLTYAQREKMKATDERVQLETESKSLSVIRMIKLLGWTKRIEQKLEEKREQELIWVWRRLMYGFVNFNANQLIPVLCMITTYSTYTLLMHRSLTASIVFSSITVFNNIRQLMDRASSILGPVTAAYSSIGRIQQFLSNSELLEIFSHHDKPTEDVSIALTHDQDIGFGESEFLWSTASTDGPQRSFCLRAAGDIIFKRGTFNVVKGLTGAGKTSLLMALLGEMHCTPVGSDSWVSLPRECGVAYAAQESWVLSDTIKENILFGSPYDKERYNKVIYQCALLRDLDMFGSKDETEVGEKGITLSGGQKARITLARAVYSTAEILLLDDVLAALDVQTSRWIVDQCFKGDLMKDRTIILVTHSDALTAPLAASVVSITGGEVHIRGSMRDTYEPEPKVETARLFTCSETTELDGSTDTETNQVLPGSREDKLVEPEEISLGRINRKAYRMYLRSMGGIFHWLSYLSAETIAQVFSILQTWWLGWWAKQYATKNDVDAPYYLVMYSAIVVVTTIFFLTQSLTDSWGRIRASRAIHRELAESVLGTTFRWLDVTPTSRVITRFTQDIQAVDGAIPQAINILTNTFLAMAIKFIVVFIYAPILLVPSLLVVCLGACFGSIYIKAQLSVKRELSTRKAPVLAVLSSTMHGLVSIRAYSAQNHFRGQLLRRVNDYTQASRIFWCLNQWIAVRLDSLSALFAATIAWYLVYASSIGPSGVGFVLAMAVSFTDLILNLVNWFNQLEVNANSLERLDQYIHIEQESKNGDAPPAYWPASGNLRVERLCASYNVDGSKVLQDVSFNVKSGESIGVVGRTGAGKSTLTLALLRCIQTGGVVTFDGVPTNSITLDTLRSSITIIPQVPELLSGSLRYNLDPFDLHDDATLNGALRSAGMFSLRQSDGANWITLDTKITGSGTNLSVGQRQIIALARAIVRQSKLLILDEATSAVDHCTDAAIQRSLRDELKRGVSVITVAHRLQTIMDYDKIMVLDAGRLVEFDTPKALLERKDGTFYALVESDHNKDALYATAVSH